MTPIEQVIFELERLLPRIADHTVRYEIRRQIQKLAAADITMSGLYADINELRHRYRQFGDIAPWLDDDFDTDDDESDDNRP